jgi:disulfide bond formation protein DsbB
MPVLSPRLSLGLVTLIAIGTIAGAWFFQLVLHLAPCQLCLEQRWPWYAAILIGGLGLGVPSLQRLALLLLGAAMLASIGLAVFHAGVEWQFWQGPAGCSGAIALPKSAGGLLDAVSETRVPSCTEAAWRLLGLSLAGWNVLISLATLLVIVLGLSKHPSGRPLGA